MKRAWLVSLIFAALLAALLLSYGRGPKSHKDQVSYTIGVQFGRSLRSQNFDLDAKMLARGIDDGLNNRKIKLSDQEMQAAMIKLAEDQQKEMRVEADKNKVKAEAFLANNKSNPAVKVTASGLQYKVVEEGSGPSPTGDEVVVVNYKGTLIDGAEFDSSYKRNQPTEFPVNGVIPGWTEGLKMMKKGGKAIFYVPPELAYGDRPRQNIPANAVLIFEVQLLDVKPPKVAKPPHSSPKPAKK